jgi:hypothetical protein
MYIDKLDCRIDEGSYKRMRVQWRDEQVRYERDIERHRVRPTIRTWTKISKSSIWRRILSLILTFLPDAS